MIDVQGLSMQYGAFKALDKISFQAKDGEILGLLGPNGAGKTTAMRLLTTYLYPSSGTAIIDGLDILQKPVEVRKRIGYLPETAPLYPDMQVDEYLRFVGAARELDKLKLTQRLQWVKDACNLTPVWKHMISELSKGYRQRVGLAQALIHDPKVLILDEPTSGLDPLQIIGIRDLIKKLAREKTILFSTHILHEVETIADRIVIINEGKIVSSGTLAELTEQVRSRGQGRAGMTESSLDSVLPRAGLMKNQPGMSLEEIFIALLKPAQREKVRV